MKGIELPINVLVIIAIAVLVLLGLVAIFISASTSGINPIFVLLYKGEACSAWIESDCETGSVTIDVNEQTGADDLQELCQYGLNAVYPTGVTGGKVAGNYYNDACKKACNCPGIVNKKLGGEVCTEPGDCISGTCTITTGATTGTCTWG